MLCVEVPQEVVLESHVFFLLLQREVDGAAVPRVWI